MAVMRIDLGPVPSEEACAQVGWDDYTRKARRECNAYIDLLRRKMGEEPEGATFKIARNAHDFGTYLSVECVADEDKEKAVRYAMECESSGPREWDDQAKRHLGLVK